MLQHLASSRLTNVKEGTALELARSYLLAGFDAYGYTSDACVRAIAVSTKSISPRRSSGKGAAVVGHRRELSGLVEATQEHASIHATIPWSRKMAMPKPPELEHSAACRRKSS